MVRLLTIYMYVHTHIIVYYINHAYIAIANYRHFSIVTGQFPLQYIVGTLYSEYMLKNYIMYNNNSQQVKLA